MSKIKRFNNFMNEGINIGDSSKLDELMSAIEKDNCVINAVPPVSGGYVASSVHKAILCNGMKISLYYNENDQGTEETFLVKINDNSEWIDINEEQYNEIKSKITDYLKNTWGEEYTNRK